jgi:hypothetical protein
MKFRRLANTMALALTGVAVFGAMPAAKAVQVNPCDHGETPVTELVGIVDGRDAVPGQHPTEA